MVGWMCGWLDGWLDVWIKEHMDELMDRIIKNKKGYGVLCYNVFKEWSIIIVLFSSAWLVAAPLVLTKTVSAAILLRPCFALALYKSTNNGETFRLLRSLPRVVLFRRL